MITLAADIGGTKISAARIAGHGGVLGEVQTVPTPAAEGSAAVVAAVVGLLGRLGLGGAGAVGLASAGVIDSDTGTVVGATDHIAGWRGTPLGAAISSATGLPVSVIGDGHAFAVGESVYGVAAACESAIVVAVGTGIGGSYVERGEPMCGCHWAAGHVGHLAAPAAEGIRCSCGRSGHLESIAGGAGMIRWYRRLGGDPEIARAEQLFGRDDDPVALTVVCGSATAIGTTVAGLTNVLDPAMVVIAGGMTRAGGSWAAALRESFARALMPVIADTPLVVSDADEWLALRGAAYVARGMR